MICYRARMGPLYRVRIEYSGKRWMVTDHTTSKREFDTIDEMLSYLRGILEEILKNQA